eukprot:g2813.t1
MPYDDDDENFSDFLSEEVDNDSESDFCPSPVKKKKKSKAKKTKAKKGGKTKAAKSTKKKKRGKSKDDKENVSPAKPSKRAKKETKSKKDAAKKKKKVIKKESEAMPLILGYLSGNNRPFTADDIFNNLHGTISKAVLKRTCDALAQTEEIGFKLNGKFKIYFPSQKSYSDVKFSDVTDLEETNKSISIKLKGNEAALKAMNAKKRELEKEPEDEALDGILSTYSKEIEDMSKRIEDIREAAKSNPIDPQAKIKIAIDAMKYYKAASHRRRCVMDVVERVSEGTGKKMNVLTQEMGLESDVDHGTCWKEVKVLEKYMKGLIPRKKMGFRKK